MLKLVKSDLNPDLHQRITRMQMDARLLQHMTASEIKAIYSELEGVRDALSKILDRADGKHV